MKWFDYIKSLINSKKTKETKKKILGEEEYEKKRFYKTRVYYEVSKCECGGLLLTPTQDGDWYAATRIRGYRCSKCNKVVKLYEKDWPTIKTEIKGLKE